MSKRNWRWIPLTALLALLVAPFQNCDSSHRVPTENSSLSKGPVRGVSETEFAKMQTDAMAILANRCARCHDGSASAPVPNVTDLVAMKGKKNAANVTYIAPGQPQLSSVYVSMIDGSQPKDGLVNMVNDHYPEVQKIREWIKYMVP